MRSFGQLKFEQCFREGASLGHDIVAEMYTTWQTIWHGFASIAALKLALLAADIAHCVAGYQTGIQPGCSSESIRRDQPL